MREYIINDSSVHKNPNAMIGKDYSIRIGIVREHMYLASSNQTRYIVEVWKNNKLFPLTCTRTSRFGGLYNYEEYNLRGFKAGESNSGLGNFTVVPGDMVIVAAADGDAREGFILGSISHFGRDEMLPANGDVAFINEFNGIQTMINKSGEYRRTFKGQPTNLAKLSEAPNGEQYPLPEYDNNVGFSYYEFDKTGSYLLTDNSSDSNPQSIKVDKPNGKIQIISGKTSLTIDKNAQSYTIENKTVTFNTTDAWNLNTKLTNIKSDNVNVKATKISTEGKWTQKGNVAVTGNAEVIGNLKSSGKTDLAGGGAGVARLGDTVTVIVTGFGPMTGTITSGSSQVSAG